MRLLAFDGRTGASGDMFLAALVGAGADPAVLEPVEVALDVRYEVGERTSSGIAATTVDVVRSDAASADAGGAADGHDHDHHHDHSHDDGSAHVHDHHAEGTGPSRSYDEVVSIVESLDLPDAVVGRALAVFERLGEAEAAVHGTSLADTHFHEVGADDAIADVVGASLLLADLDVDRVVTTPVAAGGGEVEMDHGTYPVPPPAVVELAEGADWALVGGPADVELLTPTGAAILAEIADGVETLPSLRVESAGYGAGDRALPDRPNVLRAIVGRPRAGMEREEVRVLETNLDDATPEVLGGLQATLHAAGALDVTVLPTTTKKARPGHLVKVVVPPADAAAVAERLARETGTLGVREAGATHRWIANRRLVTTTLLEAGSRHEVRVKLGSTDDGVYDVSAEYDDAAAVAASTDRPVRDVMRRAEAAAREGGATDPVICHLLEAATWRSLDEGEPYAPESLEEAEFVHAASTEWLVPVANATFPDADELRCLVIDVERLGAEVRYEEQPLGAFPHVYGPIDRSAIVDVLDMPRDDAGAYERPSGLDAYR